MLDMSVPVVAKLRRLLDSLPRETLPDILASMIRTSNKEKLQVQQKQGLLFVLNDLPSVIIHQLNMPLF